MKTTICVLSMAATVVLCFSSCSKDDNPSGCDVTQVVVVTEDISTPTTWTRCNVYVIDVNQISVASTLTIEPGTVIKFNDIVGDNSILVSAQGNIIANGTATDPIIFTSAKDDANGGDNNLDGSATQPARGDWGGISIDSDNCEFSYCKFFYGGEGSGTGTDQPTLEFSFHKGTIDHCTFGYCGGETTINGYGVVDARGYQGAAFSITNCTFYGNIKPLFINPHISIDNSNTFHNPEDLSETNQLNGIFVTNESNEAPHDVTWTENEVPFALSGPLYITDDGGASLILGEGVIIKARNMPQPGDKITIKDGINAIEGHDLPGVFFTSYLDDAHGGDTNGDENASAPAQGDWYGIQDYSASIGTNNYCYNWSNILYAQYP